MRRIEGRPRHKNGQLKSDPEKVAARMREWRHRNPEKVRAQGRRNSRNRRLRLLGLTTEQYASMTAAQGGVCAVCQQPSDHKLGLMIDHCHDTGTVRGLLWGHCNSALGHARDNPATLRALATYLERAL